MTDNTCDVTAISVIVPVYNAMKYLKEAVESILTQSFQDFELILVDDCSTDGTYEYMTGLWGSDPRVRIIQNRKNMGPALTRNHGMRISRGRYISFMDNDDCYRSDFLSSLYEIAVAYEADVVSCMGYLYTEKEEFSEDLSEGAFLEFDSNYCDEIIISPDDLKERMDGWLRMEYSIACWNKLYLRDFLMHNDIKFRSASDDRGFVFSCLLHARKYIKTPYIGNIFRNNKNSLSRNKDSNDMNGLEKAIIVLDDFAKDFMDIMGDVPFFSEHPEYCEMILAHQLTVLERSTILHYFPSSTVVSGDVFKTTRRVVKMIFGEHAPLVEFLFLQYQALTRTSVEDKFAQ